MQVKRIKVTKRDYRGYITDILAKEIIEYITIISSVAGAERGQHYHKATYQYVYILKGKIKMLARMPGGKVVSRILEPGDLSLTVPMERHAMIALDNSLFLVFTRGPRGGKDYESDTYRLSKPLRGRSSSTNHKI